MRLNWFSPLPPERTDIAHYTARIAAALQKHFDVVLWSAKAPAMDMLPAGARVEIYNRDMIFEARTRQKMFEGVNLYNMGNDARYHTEIYEVLKSIPGIVILHDTKLHHFMCQFLQRGKDYVALARTHYGESGALHAQAIVKGVESIDQNVETMPFTEAVVENALGVICHSKEVRSEIAACAKVPVLDLPLPFQSLGEKPNVKRLWEPPFNLILFGFLGTNRRLEPILRALAQFEPKELFRLSICGTLWDETFIRSLIRDLGLEGLVDIRGYVSESELDAAIASSHLAFNLRFPTLGEASGGILRSWTCGTPTLVTAAGWYKDLPPSVAYRISLETEEADIRGALTELIQNPNRFARYGSMGQAYVLKEHAPEAYVLSLKAALVDIREMEARRSAQYMMRSVASRFTAGEQPFFLSRAAEKIADVLGTV